MGYFFGRIAFGKRAIPASDNLRYRILVPDEEEQKVLAQIKSLFDQGINPIRVTAVLNEQNNRAQKGLLSSNS